MKLTVCLLVSMCWWRCLAQEQEPDILRLSRRPSLSSYSPRAPSEGVSGYRASVVHRDPYSSRKHSISTVTVQLHLKDKSAGPEATEDDFVPSLPFEKHHSKHKISKRPLEPRSKSTPKDNSIVYDSETGASNDNPSARYVLPPEGFLNNVRQNNGRYLNNQDSQYGSTPAPQDNYISSTQSAPSGSDQQSNHKYNNNPLSSASNNNYVVTPAPTHYNSNQSPQLQFVSGPSNYQGNSASQVSFVSTPAPNVNYGSNSYSLSNFGSQPQSFSNNVQFASTAAPRAQYFSTPSPSVQFAAQISQHQPSGTQNNYISTPPPHMLYMSTPSSHNQYVSSPVQFVSTPSPIQYATSAALYGSRIGSSNQNQASFRDNRDNNKQMQIDHFDNSMSGVRSPKYSPQFSENLFISSTPEPMVISTTISPKQSQNEQNWRSGITPNALSLHSIKDLSQNFNSNYNTNNNNNNYNNNNNNNNNQNQQQQGMDYVQSSSNQNNQRISQQHHGEVDSANNLVVNIMHPNQNNREKQFSNKNFQRDIEKDTEVAHMYSNGDFGWKLNPKKSPPPPPENNQQSSGIYSFSSPPNNYPPQAMSLQSDSSFEYRPYPDNPFLNHISFSTPSPQVGSGSIQSISFQPDSNQQQNINVGYSIGFGNQFGSNQDIIKADSSNNEHRFPAMNSYQGFTTSSSHPSTVQNDIVKGVKISQVNSPDQTFYSKESSNAQNNYDKLKNSNSGGFGSGDNHAPSYDITSSPYQNPQILKGTNNGEKIQSNFYGNPSKSINFNSPNVASSYYGSDGKSQSYKWSNFGAGVEVSSSSSVHSARPLTQKQEPTPSNQIVYVNNPNNVVTNTPFFFSTPKDAGNGNSRYLQSFDHESALKSIQPIDLSNVVPYSSTPQSDSGKSASFSSQYINNPPVQQSFPNQGSSNPAVNFGQNFQQEQLQISPSTINNQNAFDQGLSNFYSNYKPIDQTFYKDKNIVYNVQSYQPKHFDNSGFNEVRSYVFGSSRDLQAFEASHNQNGRPSDSMSPSNFMVSTPPDMIGHSSNVDTRQTSHIDYVPSETFRQTSQQDLKQSHRQQSSDQISSIQVNQIQPNGQSSKYHHVITHSPSSDRHNQHSSDNQQNIKNFNRQNQHSSDDQQNMKNFNRQNQHSSDDQQNMKNFNRQNQHSSDDQQNMKNFNRQNQHSSDDQQNMKNFNRQNQHSSDDQQNMKNFNRQNQPSSDDQQNMKNFNNAVYNKKINQNVESHNLEPEHANSNNYQNRHERQNNGDVLYENHNEVDPHTGSKLTTINGLQVANPYNMDLQVVSDILNGKLAIDESRLQPIREQMSRISPINLDTSALQNAVSKNEQISVQIELPNHEISEPDEYQKYSNYEAPISSRKNFNENKYKNRFEDLAYAESSRPFSNSFDKNDHESFIHNIPSIAAEQLQNSVQSVLSPHQIGAVMDQQPTFLSSRVRSNDDASSLGLEDYSRFASYENSGSSLEKKTRDHTHPIAADVVKKRPKAEVVEPYPLLKPPRPPAGARTGVNKKSEKRPSRARRHRVISNHQSRTSKQTIEEPEDFEDYDINFRIKTDLRPPPVRS